jgi:hypothetical protein
MFQILTFIPIQSKQQMLVPRFIEECLHVQPFNVTSGRYQQFSIPLTSLIEACRREVKINS